MLPYKGNEFIYQVFFVVVFIIVLAVLVDRALLSHQALPANFPPPFPSNRE